MKRILLATTVLCLTSACLPQMDMQGVDPKDYYAEHPVENNVENRHLLYTLDFNADRNRLSQAAASQFRAAIHAISPEAVDEITVTMTPSEVNNRERRQHIAGL